LFAGGQRLNMISGSVPLRANKCEQHYFRVAAQLCHSWSWPPPRQRSSWRYWMGLWWISPINMDWTKLIAHN
jgi:hypothetical protein